MRLVILNNADAVASWMATYVRKRIIAFAPTEARPFVLGLPTGSSPLKVYEKLIAMFKRGEISFANVVTFKCYTLSLHDALPIDRKSVV